jgi:hypothetical protein
MYVTKKPGKEEAGEGLCRVVETLGGFGTKVEPNKRNHNGSMGL